MKSFKDCANLEEIEKIKEQRKIYNTRYHEKHKEYMKEYSRKYRKEHPENVKKWAKNCYERNKENILASQKEYIKKNRKKVTEMVLRRRKEVAKELTEQGQIWCYLPKTARENKMVESLAKKIDTSEIIARELLEQRDWNYKAIIMENKGE